jgi:hypothetical protein
MSAVTAVASRHTIPPLCHLLIIGTRCRNRERGAGQIVTNVVERFRQVTEQ